MVWSSRFIPLIGRMRSLNQLTKLPVCLMVAFSSLFGSILAGPLSLYRAVLIGLGMLFLACGSAALNSWQEIGLDSSMCRTKNRPLPRGVISQGRAAGIAFLLILTGLMVLFLASHLLLTVGIALVAVFLYNLVYTPLKTRTVAAIIPGAVSGALPPYIGWIAAGGDPLSRSAQLMVVLFILWQVPHSLLVMLSYKDDYWGNDIPSLIKLLPESSLKRIFIIWVGAFMVVLLCWTELLMGFTNLARIFLLISVCAVMILFCLQLPGRRRPEYHSIFIQFNCYLLIIMTVLAGDRLFLS